MAGGKSPFSAKDLKQVKAGLEEELEQLRRQAADIEEAPATVPW